MSKQPEFEIPEQLRTLASKSVDQASKAWQDFISVSQSAVEKADSSAEDLQQKATDIGEKQLSFADRSVSSALDFAQKIVEAKSMEEALELQKSYIQDQIDALGTHSADLGETLMKNLPNKK